MKEKGGFTLIELLAVIVILAILSLITIPIVLNIIDNSKKKSNLRSLEGYGRSVESKLYDLKASGLIEINDDGLVSANEEAEYTGTSVSCSIKKIVDGKIQLDDCSVGGEDGYCYKNGKALYGDECTVSDDSKESTNNQEESAEHTSSLPHKSELEGQEYQINVDGTNTYKFYVLSENNDGTVNLIMDKNICSDGTLATSSNTCTTLWISNTDYNDDPNFGYGNTDKGPITAMNYANNATSNWTNVLNINVDYYDNDYGAIKTNGNITSITNVDGITTATYTNLKARLPMVSELRDAGCTTSSGSCPLWLVNNLNNTTNSYPNGNAMNGIYAYWTLDAYCKSGNYYIVWVLGYNSNIYNSESSNTHGNPMLYFNFGVRPVITLEKSKLS